MNPLHKLTAIALSLLMQGPAMLVQEVAWLNMLVSYTQQGGLKRGVIETFDGGHPCKLCKAAETLRHQDNQNAPEPSAPPEMRQSLAWAPMIIPARGSISPMPHGFDVTIILPPPWRCQAKNRPTDGPETPPPERV